MRRASREQLVRQSGPGPTLANMAAPRRSATNGGSASVVPIEPRPDHYNVAVAIATAARSSPAAGLRHRLPEPLR
jgi:hypothetical protein